MDGKATKVTQNHIFGLNPRTVFHKETTNTFLNGVLMYFIAKKSKYIYTFSSEIFEKIVFSLV